MHDPKTSLLPFERFKYRTRLFRSSGVIKCDIPLLQLGSKSAPELLEHVDILCYMLIFLIFLKDWLEVLVWANQQNVKQVEWQKAGLGIRYSF